MTPRILLLGNTGQLGWELQRALLTLGKITALDYPALNMADPDNILEILNAAQPDIIINATAYTDVDRAESEPGLAMAINGTGPGILAEEAKKRGAALLHYSTDYVFDGSKGAPYTEKDCPNPLNTYGKTKLAGEQAVIAVGGACLIIRTSWVYTLRRPSFVTKVLQWAREYETLRIVDDQVSSPTWARTLAQATAQILSPGKSGITSTIAEKSGLYHFSNSGFCSRYEWAQAILELTAGEDERMTTKVLPAKSSDFNTPAARPTCTPLNTDKLRDTFNIKVPDWKTVLELVLKK